jgi:zinc protease
MTEALAQNVEEHKLDNGLTVLLKEDHSAPVATVWAWYRVGSRNEQPGRTGISHWVEHMLFKGTPNWPKGRIMRAISAVGGECNGFTSQDETVYLASVPCDHIELPLEIEADRMTNAVFDPAEVESERTVIISEREGAENQPEFLLNEQMMAAAFAVHSYRWQVIGWKSDLRAMTREELFEHYRTYYAPNNCALVIVGDFESGEVLEKVAARFGKASAAAQPGPVRSAEPPQQGERRVSVRRPGMTAHVHVVYHIPDARHADIPALLLLDALLSGGKGIGAGGGVYLGRSARLYRALVETRLATSVGSNAMLHVDPHLLGMFITVRDGVQPEQAEQALYKELDRLSQEPPGAEELEKALVQTRAQNLFTVDGVSAQAFNIGLSNQLESMQFFDRLLEGLRRVKADDIVRVARTYLGADNRTVGTFVPTGSAQEAGSAE